MKTVSDVLNRINEITEEGAREMAEARCLGLPYDVVGKAKIRCLKKRILRRMLILRGECK